MLLILLRLVLLLLILEKARAAYTAACDKASEALANAEAGDRDLDDSALDAAARKAFTLTLTNAYAPTFLKGLAAPRLLLIAQIDSNRKTCSLDDLAARGKTIVTFISPLLRDMNNFDRYRTISYMLQQTSSNIRSRATGCSGCIVYS